MSLIEDNKDKDQKLLEEYSRGGETGNTIDLHMKMEDLNLQTTVSLDRDSSQRHSELTEYSVCCKPFMIGEFAIGKKNYIFLFYIFNVYLSFHIFK